MNKRYESEHFILFTDLMDLREFILGIKVTRKITMTQNHHTYRPNYATFNSTKGVPSKMLQICENVRDYHINTNGWYCGGQHGFTFPNGWVALCKQGVADNVRIRDFNKKPAGIKGYNNGALCFEHIGNFNWGGDVMTNAQKEAILVLYATVHEKFNLPVNKDTCVYHTWKSSKSCPGTGFWGDGNSVKAAENGFFIELRDKIKEFQVPQWKVDPLERLHKRGFVDYVDEWKKKLDKSAPTWLVFILFDKLVTWIDKRLSNK
jgi:hypothetical protein